MKVRIKRKDLNKYFWDKGIHMRLKGAVEIVLEGEPVKKKKYLDPRTYVNAEGFVAALKERLNSKDPHPQPIALLKRDHAPCEGCSTCKEDIQDVIEILNEIATHINNN